jgi:3-isopropylmalate dehydrogenase
MGKGKSNPTGMILSVVLLLKWLTTQGWDENYLKAGNLLDKAVCKAYADGKLVPYEAGGNAGTKDILDRILDNL